MIRITDKKDCCGCQACASVCAKRSITMQEDNEGFLYPVVDASTCTDCGLCEKVCPVINQDKPRKPLKVYAAKNKNEEIRRHSSSGGIFTPLAEAVIRDGGVAFGAKFDKEWNVIHAWTDTIEGIADFRGSKYVQSTIGNTYREAREFLKQGRQVLFSGTPCQIAGLRKFLRKEYDNLLAVDVVCHGVPSPLVWRKYLEETRENLRTGREVGKNTVSSSLMDLPVITGISFRDKTHGWKKYGFRLRYAAYEAAGNSVSVPANDSERTLLQPFPDNVFMKGFLKNLYLRPSCYACASRSGKSGSDISIADFWGVQNYYPEFDDDKGIGLVLVNTDKGRKAYEQVNANDIESTYEQGLIQNPCLEHSVPRTKYVGTFWTGFEAKGMAVVKEIELRMRPSIIKRFINRVKHFIRRILSIITDTKHNHNKA